MNKIYCLAIVCLAIVAGTVFSAGQAHAATWDGNGGVGGYFGWGAGGNGVNWVGNTPPVAGDALVFATNDKTSNTNDFAAGFAFNTITFNNTAGAFTLSGNAITLGDPLSGGFTNVVDNNDNSPQNINFDITIDGTHARVFRADSGVLNFNGAISKNTSPMNLFVRGTEITRLLGIVSDGAGGALTLRKDQSGLLVLGAANTYTGDTIVTDGILRLNDVNALQNSTLDIAGADPVSFNAAGTTYNLGGLKGSDNLAIGANTISVGANAASTTYSGDISGIGGNLTKVGAGTLTLSGGSTYTGTTDVDAGTLIVNGTHTGTGAVSVGSNSTLAGFGTLPGATSTTDTTSIISPGDPAVAGGIGTLTLGSLDASLGAMFDFQLGTTSDQLALTGLMTGSGPNSLLFDFTDVAGFAVLTPYTLFTFSSSSGLEVGDLVANLVPSGHMLDPDFGTGGWLINSGNLQVQFAAIVPEPSTFMLGLIGLVGLSFFRWPRRR